jgi:hypothetical protein
MILRIGSQLVSASVDLFTDGRTYAAAALTRQLVEVEYLAWAFETRDEDAARWLRSDRAEREAFFTPRKLRLAAQGKKVSRGGLRLPLRAWWSPCPARRRGTAR